MKRKIIISESRKQQIEEGKPSPESTDLPEDKVEQAAEQLAKALVMQVQHQNKQENEN